MIAETLRTWLLGVIAAGMIVGILYALLPRGRMKAVAHTVGGMALLLVIVRPLLGLDLTELALRYEDYRQQIQALTEEYRRSGDAEFAALIADKTAAYIASKGADMGIECTPQVTTELRQGVPYPCTVVLDVPREEAFSAWISETLDIDGAHQLGVRTMDDGEAEGGTEDIPLCRAGGVGGDRADGAAGREKGRRQRGELRAGRGIFP